MKRTFINSLGIVIYRLILDVLYVTSLVPVYNSEGYLNNSNKFSIIVSWITLLLFLPVIIKLYKRSNLTSNILVLLFLVSFVPMTSMMAFMPMENEFFILYNLYWVFLLSSYFVIPQFSSKKIRFKPYFSKTLGIIVIIFSLSIIFVSGYYFKFRLTFDLENVYGLRAEVQNSMIPNVFNYILPAAGNILPIIIVYFIAQKKIKTVLILSFVILLNFSIGGHKAIFFNLILAFVGYYFFRNKFITKYVWALILFVLLSIFEFIFLDSYLLLGYGVRRVMYVPALLNYRYYTFFFNNEFDYYRQSFLRHFGIVSPYNDTISHEIGNFMGYPDMGANNGLFSDTYANFGEIGIFIHPIILIIIFKLFDRFSYGIEYKYLFLPIVVVVTIFNSSFFPTALLTHGMLLLMVVLYLFPRTTPINPQRT